MFQIKKHTIVNKEWQIDKKELETYHGIKLIETHSKIHIMECSDGIIRAIPNKAIIRTW